MQDNAVASKYSDAEVEDLKTANQMLEEVVTELKAQFKAANATIETLQGEQTERALETTPTGYVCKFPFQYQGKTIATKDLTDALVAELLKMPDVYAGCLKKV
jgi:hypothetical protein